ncbi:MAG TPA: cupin domain-containing protein [Burkholderiaceae bacterium]|nr:cupin domain-containing protein [Burkholderiaceae bacterium]
MKRRYVIAAGGAALALAGAMPAAAHEAHEGPEAHEAREIVTPNFEHSIPNIPGKSLVAVVVDYPPGAASAPHSHAKSAFIYGYVVSGTIESQVNDGPVQRYRAGESFYEPPGSSHPVSRNASNHAPAKLLAVFVVDTDDRVLTTANK